LLLLPLVVGCAHHTPSWRNKGFEPAEAPVDAIEASFGPRRVALLIGVGSYDDPLFGELRHAEADALELGEILESHDYGGFDRVITLTTPVQTTQARILTELASLRNDLRSQDTLLLYFSGHGTMRLDERKEPILYLTASDTKARSLDTTALELAELQKFVSRVRAERKALIIDACFHGQGKSRLQPTVLQEIQSLDAYPTLGRRVKLGQSEAHLFATSWGRPAREDDVLGHGVYTYHLLEGLTWNQLVADANHDGLVTIYEAHDFARGATVIYTSGAQIPEAYFRVVGERDLVVTGEPEARLESQLALIYYYDTDSAFDGAALLVDGREKGVFPGSMPVDPGMHRITIVGAQGTVLFDRVIDIGFQESIPADAIDQRPPAHRATLSIAGGPIIAVGSRIQPLLGTATGGPELNIGLRLLKGSRKAGLTLSLQGGYNPITAQLTDGGDKRSRHMAYFGLGFGYRWTHRNVSFGFNWRIRGHVISAVDGTCDEGPLCDPWLVFGQGPYIEQVFHVDRRFSLVIGEELMGMLVDTSGSGDPKLGGSVGFRIGLELNL